VVEAVLAGELDVAFLGPNPAINAYFVSQGEAVRVVSGSTAGGAQLVVRQDVKAPRDLLGQRIATPALANTQDITARVWLRDEGIEEGKGDDEVEILPIPPSEVLRLFARREVAGAWLPEPWSSRMVIETGGRVLVDEASLWPDGRFPTTVVIASVASLRARRVLIERFLRAHERAIDALRTSPGARDVVRNRIEKDLGLALPKPVVDRAYSKLEFSTNLLPEVMIEFARRAESVGYLRMNRPIEPMFAPDLVP
jgi:NitT/TauT family transport system substrate-binding protein